MSSGPGPLAGLIGSAIGSDLTDPWVTLMLSPGARVFAFVWGLLWGSFANVVIYRVPRGMSVMRPRSACPKCETPIAAYDNIPVLSFLILRGRCRHCGEPMALRYLVVELLGGVLAFATYLQYVHVPLIAGQEPSLAATLVSWQLWFVFGLALMIVTYVDLDLWIIPDAVVLPLALVGWVVAIGWPSLLGVPWMEAVGASLGGFALFAGIRWFYLRFRGIEGLGLGDAKLLLMVGAFTGAQGLVWTIGAGALQGVLVSVPMLLMGRRIANTDLHDVHGDDDPTLGERDPEALGANAVPFGPFLAVAALEFVLLKTHIESLTQWLLLRVDALLLGG